MRYEEVIQEILQKQVIGKSIPRPNSATNGTLSGHAAGEPFEKLVYHALKDVYPDKIFKQYELLNWLYSTTPDGNRQSYLSPTLQFLLQRGITATETWSVQSQFKEKQNDTADIVFLDKEHAHTYLIDVKTRNSSKRSQPPNIISAYKMAKACKSMLEYSDFENIDFDYIEIDWFEEGEYLTCRDFAYASLFKIPPEKLYINWAAAMQIQFNVSDIPQDFELSHGYWAIQYLQHYVNSCSRRLDTMNEKLIKPFLPVLNRFYPC